MKRSILVPLILLLYLIVMSVMGWSHYSQENNLVEYFAIIGVTLGIIIGLHFLLKRREKMRLENRKQRDASYRRNFRDDNIL